jgi:hypothetical protein
LKIRKVRYFMGKVIKETKFPENIHELLMIRRALVD